jgi:HSP20 family protein
MTNQTTSVVPSAPSAPDRQQRPVTVPPYRVTESAEGFTVHVALPGVDKSAVETTVDRERLIIKAHRTWVPPETWVTLHRETKQADSQLVLELSREIDQNSVSADLSNGILKVFLAKAKSLQPRKVEIA